MTDAVAKVDAREVFKDGIALIGEVRDFAVKPPESPTDVEARLRDLHTRVRRETPFDQPKIGVDVMNILKKDGQLTEVPNFAALQTILRGVRYPGTDMQLINGTGTFFMVNGTTGEMSFTQADGPIHNLPAVKGDDGVERKLFPGGLADYAVGKTLVEVAMTSTGKEDGTGNQENNDWAVEVTGASAIHMGGATGKDREGRTVFGGASGVEMTADAIARLNGELTNELSKDGDYTCAGYVDKLVADWMIRVATGQELTLGQAQADIDDAFSLFHELDSEEEHLPPHYH